MELSHSGIDQEIEKNKEIKKKTLAGKNGENSVNLAEEVLIFENRKANQWLSTVEAASFLRVSENALRIMVHRNHVKAYKFGRRLRFKLADCQALILLKGAI